MLEAQMKAKCSRRRMLAHNGHHNFPTKGDQGTKIRALEQTHRPEPKLSGFILFKVAAGEKQLEHLPHGRGCLFGCVNGVNAV